LFDDGRERGGVIDVAKASDQIDALIDRRAAGREEAANPAEMMWQASVRRHHEKLRRERRAEWVRYWSVLADPLRASADEFDARAERLLEEPGDGAEVRAVQDALNRRRTETRGEGLT